MLLALPCYGAKLKYPELSTYWGGSDMNYCGGHDMKDACIGESDKKGCVTRKIRAARNYDDEFSVLMMMAREINQTGALFCPTQLDAQNNDDKGYTAYYEPIGTNTCVWLCQDGWTGDRCDTAVEKFDGTCSLSLLKQGTYDDVKSTHDSGYNIEDKIHFFHINDYQKCDDRKRNKHDMALIVVRWLESGTGAFVRQMMVLSQRTSKIASDIRVYPASKSLEILVCINGYKPNLSKTDCEPINADLCTRAQASTKMCDGWNLSAFDSEKHVLQEDGSCYRYVCKETGYAFAGVGDSSCVECTTNLRGGLNPKNDTCVKCEAGKIFNKNDVNNAYCSPAIGLSKTDMMYGRGKSKNRVEKLSDQCWTKAGAPDEYKKCVMGN